MIVDQEAVRFEAAGVDRRQRLGEVGRGQHAAAPAAQKLLHAVENAAVVIDAQRDRAGEPAGAGSRHGRNGRARRGSRRARHLDRETRAAPDHGFQRHFTVEHARDALDDGEAQAYAARDPRPLVEAVELLEHRAALAVRNADAGIVDIDAQLAAAAPAADQHAAHGRVFDGVGDEVLQKPPQQAAIRTHRERARHEVQLQAFLAGQRRKFDVEPLQQLVDTEIGHFRLHGAGIEPRNVQKCGENLFDGFEGGVDVLHQVAVLGFIVGLALALDQTGDVEPRRIERLQDVMARRGDETGLRHIGLVGFGLSAFELGVEPGQLLGALAHATLQRGIGALQGLGRLHARGDVGERRHQAAVGHVI